MKIYIIQGSSGYFDDYNDWAEAVFINEENAENFIARKNRLVKIFKYLSQTIQEKWDEDNGLYITYSSKSIAWSWKYLYHNEYIIKTMETKD